MITFFAKARSLLRAPLEAVLAHVWRREIQTARLLQPSRIAAVAVLARNHAHTAIADPRISRALSHEDRRRPRFASVGKTTDWLAQWATPESDWDVADARSDDLIPLNLVAALVRSRRSRVSVRSSDGVTKVLVSVPRSRRELERSLPDIVAAASADGIGVTTSPDYVELSVVQGPVRRRLKDVLEHAAATIGVDPSALVAAPVEEDGYLAFAAESVWKIRLPFMYGNKLGPLINEWIALSVLASNPDVVDAVHYEATVDCELLQLERIEGRTLADIVAQSPPNRGFATRTLVRLADVCAAMDAHGVVHRDLQKQNILVDAGEALHVIDFDQAVLVDPADGVEDVKLWRAVRPLVPWVSYRQLVSDVGWSGPWAGLLTTLTELWAACRTSRFALDLPGARLTGDEPLWPRWHAILGAEQALRGHDVSIVGDELGFFGVLVALRGGRSVSLLGTDASRELLELLELLEVHDVVRVTDSTPTASTVLVLGPGSDDQLSRAEAAAGDATCVIADQSLAAVRTCSWDDWPSRRIIGARGAAFTVFSRAAQS